MSALNLDVATRFVAALAESGLRDVCLSPGSRSGPLAIAVARHPRLRHWVHLDERCAGFFALGLAKRSGRPAAVLTTSGTAAAELHPAVIEAFHSGTPLLVLTADRPPEAHDRGANQTIRQPALFDGATRWRHDPGPPDAATTDRIWTNLAARSLAVCCGPPAGPVHLNLPFREPLLPAEAPDSTVRTGSHRAAPRVTTGVRSLDEPAAARLAGTIGSSSRVFVHAGSLPPDGTVLRCVRALAGRENVVIHAEPTSHLRRTAIPALLRNTEALLRDETFAREHRPDVVVRLGAAPTSRSLAEWLARGPRGEVVLVDPDASWRDPDALATEMVHCDVASTLEAILAQLPASIPGWQREWSRADAHAGAAVDAALAAAPFAEPHVVRALARAAPQDATVVAGSSMAIRDLDWFWPPDEGCTFISNRGASGIDGFISTALGASAANPEEPTVAVCGDLTLLHDLGGFAAAARYGLPVIFVVLDNDGGGIFSFLREARFDDVFEDVFATPAGLELEQAARLYGVAYQRVDTAAGVEQGLRAALDAGRCAIVDARFSRDATVNTHRSLWAAAAAATRAARRAGPET
jgi:2-succinyl-5-enolpyruvyl-6-hydroxy-3-cyclohexene-1-carboxylate synthase